MFSFQTLPPFPTFVLAVHFLASVALNISAKFLHIHSLPTDLERETDVFFAMREMESGNVEFSVCLIESVLGVVSVFLDLLSLLLKSVVMTNVERSTILHTVFYSGGSRLDSVCAGRCDRLS